MTRSVLTTSRARDGLTKIRCSAMDSVYNDRLATCPERRGHSAGGVGLERLCPCSGRYFAGPHLSSGGRSVILSPRSSDPARPVGRAGYAGLVEGRFEMPTCPNGRSVPGGQRF